MARTKQRRTYLPYTFPAVSGTYLPTRVDGRLSINEQAQAQSAKSNWPMVAMRQPAASGILTHDLAVAGRARQPLDYRVTHIWPHWS